MNHIFKTIFNKTTGEINVVSEKTSLHCQSESSSQVDLNSDIELQNAPFQFKSNKSNLAYLIGLLFVSTIATPAHSALIYTGDAKDLIQSSAISGNFNQLLNKDNVQGVIFSTNGIPQISNAELTVDYLSSTGIVPDFIVSGYTELSSTPTTVEKNTVIVQQGNIRGGVYAGLAHWTQVTGDINCSISICSDKTYLKLKDNISNNNVSALANRIMVKGDVENLIAGYTGINLNYGDLTAAKDTAIAYANSNISIENYVEENTLTSNENQIITDGNNSFRDLTAGYAGINLSYGNFIAAEAEGKAYIYDVGEAYANADASAYHYSDALKNTLISNENQITINGDNSFNNITTGYVGINLNSGDFTAAKANANADIDSFSRAETRSSASATFFSSNNVLMSNENSITIKDSNSFNNLVAGYAGINLSYGDFIAAEAVASAYTSITKNSIARANSSAGISVETYDSTLTSNENQIIIDGSNSFNNSIVGYTGFNITAGNLTAASAYASSIENVDASSVAYILEAAFTSNNNKATINGDNTFNDLTVGYAGISLSHGNFTGGLASSVDVREVEASASARANLFSGTLISNENQIIVDGNNSFNDVTTGYAGINLSYGNFTAAEANAKIRASASIAAYAEAYSNTLTSSDNKITIKGINSFNNLATGYTDIKFSYGDLIAADATVSSTAAGGSSTAYAAADANTDISTSTLTANNNQIVVEGDNSFNDLVAGYAGINLSFGDFVAGNTEDFAYDYIYSASAHATTNVSSSTLTSNGNQIVVNGNNSLKSITAGSTGINLKYGNLTDGKMIDKGVERLGKAFINADLKDTKLSASGNTIDLKGESFISGDLKTGVIDFNIQHGILTNGDGVTSTPEVYTNGPIPVGDNYINLNGTSVMANNNTISIEGSHTFTDKNSVIYGGSLSYNKDMGYIPETYDVFTGNTLNYANRTPITIKEIGNFQTYNFTLDPEQNKNIAMITADKISLGTNSDNFSDASQQLSSDVFVTGIRSGKALSTGTEFLLMQGNIEGSGSGHDTDGLEQKNVQQGISLLYDVQTKVDANTGKVTATIISGHDEPENPDPKVNPQLKSLLEGNLASLMLLTRSADNLAYNTFSAITEQNRQKGLVPFVQSSGHHARYNSGSHIDANGGLMTAGISFQNDKLTLAVFSENGWDSYDSHNTFADVAKVDASGNNRFNGGGIFGQYNFNNGLYADASFRAGRLHSNYKTDDIRNAVTGETASYKTDSKYLGAHAGLGYQFQINPLNSYDLNLKYLWANTEAQDLMVAGDEIHFDKLNSHRLRLNGENSYQFNPSWSLLLGTGLEYEFEGEAEGTTYQRFRMDAPSVKGFTALGSLGVRFQPVSNKNLTIDFKGQGYLGERDGGGALLHMQYAF